MVKVPRGNGVTGGLAPASAGTAIRARAARYTLAGSVPCRPTGSRATSTTPARAGGARWWRSPSRARRSSTPIRRMGPLQQLPRTADNLGTGLG